MRTAGAVTVTLAVLGLWDPKSVVRVSRSCVTAPGWVDFSYGWVEIHQGSCAGCQLLAGSLSLSALGMGSWIEGAWIVAILVHGIDLGCLLFECPGLLARKVCRTHRCLCPVSLRRGHQPVSERCRPHCWGWQLFECV